MSDSAFPFIALNRYPDYDAAAMAERSREFAAWLDSRRTVRDYAPEPVPRAVIESCIRAAGTAPSGANRQPWHFVAVSDPTTKSKIRKAAEAGATDLWSLQAELGVASGCGSCKEVASEILHDVRQSQRAFEPTLYTPAIA